MLHHSTGTYCTGTGRDGKWDGTEQEIWNSKFPVPAPADGTGTGNSCGPAVIAPAEVMEAAGQWGSGAARQ